MRYYVEFCALACGPATALGEPRIKDHSYAVSGTAWQVAEWPLVAQPNTSALLLDDLNGKRVQQQGFVLTATLHGVLSLGLPLLVPQRRVFIASTSSLLIVKSVKIAGGASRTPFQAWAWH